MEQITLSNGARLLLQHIPEARIASAAWYPDITGIRISISTAS